MNRVTKAPGQYLQGTGLLGKLGAILADKLNGSVLCVADRFAKERFEALYASAFPAGALTDAEFGGECTEEEAVRLAVQAKNAEAALVLGVGGGKALDAAKAAAYFAGVPMAAVPTAPSSDAPCSALSVLYREDGRLSRYLHLPNGPSIVIADLDILAAVPPRLLAAGMGDALSTWFEARACAASGGKTDAGGCSTAMGLAAARGCWEILRQKGLSALEDVRAGRCTAEVGDVIECSLSLSAMGFENGGLAAAHGLNNAISSLGLSRLMHGETVAFCTLVQLWLEGARELEEALSFCKKAGLPTSLSALGITEEQSEKARAIAEYALSDPENPIHHMPVNLTEKAIAEALMKTF